LLFPVILVILYGGVFIFRYFVKPEQQTIYVIDQTGIVFPEFVSMFDDTLGSGEPVYIWDNKRIPAAALDEFIEDCRQLVLEKEIDGYMVFPENLIDSSRVIYAARSVSNFEEQRRFQQALTSIVTNMRLGRVGLSPEVIRREQRLGRVRIITPQITEEGAIERRGEGLALAFVLGFIFYFMLAIWGQMVMRSVIEEKSQRITETIVSSIKPLELMVGKMVGICGLGVTQIIVFLLFILAIVNFGGGITSSIMGDTQDIEDIIQFLNAFEVPVTILLYFAVFFILGYLLYSSMQAAIGAICTTEDEAQHLQIIVMLPIIIQFLMMFAIIENPEAPMAYWFSLFPLFTPLLMFARVTVMYPQTPDGLFLSIFLMTITVILIIILAAKIYRIGILMYGKRPSLKELYKWVRYS